MQISFGEWSIVVFLTNNDVSIAVCRDDFTPTNQINRQHKDIFEHVIDTINKNCHRINQVAFQFLMIMFSLLLYFIDKIMLLLSLCIWLYVLVF